MKRRTFLKGLGVTAVGAAAVTGGGYGLWRTGGQRAYRDALNTIYRPADLSITDRNLIVREIARYATMAPNSHNAQPWRISIENDAIVFKVDRERLCPVVDPDDHHVFVSLGCAAENARLAAEAFGLDTEFSFDESTEVLRVSVSSMRREHVSPQVMHKFDAVPKRQSTRSAYDGSRLTDEEIKQLAMTAEGFHVNLTMLTDSDQLEGLLEHVVDGNRIQMGNAAFIAELKHWIRSSYYRAVATRDGLFTLTSGFPATPEWIGSRSFDAAFTEAAETEKYRRHVRTSSGIAVFVGANESKASWSEVGRCFERFAIQATSMGILHAHLNQPVEVTEVRRRLTSFLDIGRKRPDLVIRFGRGTPLPKSLRRSLEGVLDA